MKNQTNLTIDKTEYITLQSINAEENRYRAYRISITSVVTTKSIFAVTCSWGRISNLNQQKHFIFEDEKKARKFVTSILNKRKRNHYTIIDKSVSFPGMTILKQIPMGKVIYHQASLFAEAI